ncbi:hypothetical protein NicSoilC12_07200 [Arthrobacter sp. NicSoilC12]|nr:hypothetical protein NicSoilC12_07200 [Arthrobacter sp. NicSoilC12]
MKERRDKQRSPRTQQIPRVKAGGKRDDPARDRAQGSRRALRRTRQGTLRGNCRTRRRTAPEPRPIPPASPHTHHPRKLSIARMSTPLEQAVHGALATVIDPELRRPSPNSAWWVR